MEAIIYVGTLKIRNLLTGSTTRIIGTVDMKGVLTVKIYSTRLTLIKRFASKMSGYRILQLLSELNINNERIQVRTFSII